MTQQEVDKLKAGDVIVHRVSAHFSTAWYYQFIEVELSEISNYYTTWTFVCLTGIGPDGLRVPDHLGRRIGFGIGSLLSSRFTMASDD